LLRKATYWCDRPTGSGFTTGRSTGNSSKSGCLVSTEDESRSEYNVGNPLALKISQRRFNLYLVGYQLLGAGTVVFGDIWNFRLAVSSLVSF